MGQHEDIAASVVASLSVTATTATTRVVVDAFRLDVAEDDKYDESTVPIEKLAFSSYAVGGLAAAALTPQQGEVRSRSVVTVPLSDSSDGKTTSQMAITLFGPGDVRGIDPAQIVRRHPAPGAVTAEETVLAHIEFDRPELPWAFSATTVGPTMKPWLALIVVEKSAARWLPATALLPLLRVPLAELPDLGDAAFWAHSQGPGPTDGITPGTEDSPALSVRLSPEFAPVNLSRLLSPRILRDGTDYIAALVPITDVGVRAGRGLTGGGLSDAWNTASEDPFLLPVYDSWEFRTGPDGDFRSIAVEIDGVVAPYEVGRRFIDMSEPGAPLASLADGEPGDKQVLRCALFSPTDPPPEKLAAETAVWPEAKTQELRAKLDLPAEIEGLQEPTAVIDELPIVGPRIYAKAHRGTRVIVGADWFAELNLSPLARIVAGLGTRVVQRDQEQLMQAAWAQVGEVEKANRAIALAQLGELLAERVHSRLGKLQESHLLQVAAPLAPRISLVAGATLAAQVASSATPIVTMSGSFRRMTRPDGPVLRRATAATRVRGSELIGADAGMRDFTRTYVNPDGVAGLSTQAIADLDVVSVSGALGISQSRVVSELGAARIAMRDGIVAHLSDTSSWRAPLADLDVVGEMATRWGERMLLEPANPAVAKVRDQRTAPLIAELSKSRHVRAGSTRELLESRATTLNNSLLVRLGRVEEPAPPAGRAVGRGALVIRRSPIGGAIGRVGAGRFAEAAAGRVGTGIRGVTTIDVAALTRVTSRTDAVTRSEAITALAGLATVPLTPVLDRVSTLTADTLRAGMSAFIDPGGLLGIATVPRRDTLAIGDLNSALRPADTVRAALRGRLKLSPALIDRCFTPVRIRRVMAAPSFPRAMYQALHDYDPEWLVPGLRLLPANEYVTVLSTNSQFMEAFLVGLSDEMGRELLWRNYPTDQSGTYFRRFWDDQQDELRAPIHAFSRTALGEHISLGGDGGSAGRAVIVVKSELVRRFPDLIIQVVRNQGTVADPVFEKPGQPEGEVVQQLFAAHLPPDFALVGVNLSIAELQDPKWWIVIAEHPTATRFERPGDDSPLAGGRFLGRTSNTPGAPTLTGGATFAADKLHDPTRIAFQAMDLIKTRG